MCIYFLDICLPFHIKSINMKIKMKLMKMIFVLGNRQMEWLKSWSWQTIQRCRVILRKNVFFLFIIKIEGFFLYSVLRTSIEMEWKLMKSFRERWTQWKYKVDCHFNLMRFIVSMSFTIIFQPIQCDHLNWKVPSTQFDWRMKFKRSA